MEPAVLPAELKPQDPPPPCPSVTATLPACAPCRLLLWATVHNLGATQVRAGVVARRPQWVVPGGEVTIRTGRRCHLSLSRLRCQMSRQQRLLGTHGPTPLPFPPLVLHDLFVERLVIDPTQT